MVSTAQCLLARKEETGSRSLIHLGGARIDWSIAKWHAYPEPKSFRNFAMHSQRAVAVVHEKCRDPTAIIFIEESYEQTHVDVRKTKRS